MKYDMVVALVGQPNVGKSTLFNRLIGKGKSHIGNWPGKTVELIRGMREYDGYNILFVDLPGIYDLVGTSEEEEIAIKYLLGELGEKKHKHRSSFCEICPLRRFCPLRKICPLRRISKEDEKIYTPDVVVVILDANNLESGLTFLISVREIFRKVVVAINKIDEIREGIDIEKIEKFFGSPVVKISALKGEGLEELLDKIIEVWKKGNQKELIVDYGKSIEEKIREISEKLKVNRGIAIKLLEGAEVKGIKLNYNIREEIKRRRIEIAKGILVREKREIVIGRFDEFLLRKILGPTISILILLSSIFLTFSVNTGFPLSDILRYLGFEEISNFIERYSLISLMESFSSFVLKFSRDALGFLPEKVTNFIVEGLLGGFFFLVSFLPLIFSLLFFITLLEDSGLFSRMALALHRITSKLSLSGKTIFPLMFGLGCNVPAVVSTRILDKREKIAISLSVPFVICQARLVVLTALVSFLPISTLYKIILIVFTYLLSITLYFFVGNIISRILGKKKGELIIEIPKLRMPSIRVALWNSWMLTKHFVEKAGTIIVLLSAIVWVLIESGGAESIGRILEPLLYPIGIKSWKIAFAVFQGMIAKEGFLVTLNQLYEGKSFLEASELSLPELISLTFFLMFYVPCMATIIAIKSETGSWKLAITSILLSFLVAYLVSISSYLLLSMVL